MSRTPPNTTADDGLNQPDYRPISRRRRLLILLLAVVTAVVVVLTLLSPPGGVQRKRAGPAPCAPGQTQGCVGGMAEVIVPAGASAPAAASAPVPSAPAR